MTLGKDATETITLCIAVVFLAAMAAWVVRALTLCEGRKHARAAFAAMGDAFRACSSGRVEDDVSLIVRAKVEQQKVQQFRRTMSSLCFAGGIFTLNIAVNIATEGERVMTLTQDVTHLSLQFTGVCILLCPEIVTWRTIDLFFVFMLLCGCIYAAPFACRPELMTQSISVIDFCVAALVVSRRSLRITLPMTFLYAVSSSATIWRHGAYCVARPMELAVGHFALVLGISAAGHLLESGMQALLRQGIEMQTTRELLAAACGLLRSICDVVVELDASGVITSPAHDLGSFLLKGPDFALKSHRLVDFLAKDEDARLFERKLLVDPPSDVGLAEALHVRMKDGDRNLVRVEIFSFKFRHVDSQPRFMVGLREFADDVSTGGRAQRVPEDAEEAPGPSVRELPAAAAAARDQAEWQHGAEERRASASSWSGASEPSEISGATPASQGTDDPTPAVLTVDTTDRRVPVRGVSAGFQMRVGRLSPATCLLDLLEQDKVQDFVAWLKMAAKYGPDWPASRVTLNLRQGRVKTTITVHEELDGSLLDPERLPLLVSGIKIARGLNDSCKGARPYTDFRGTPSTPREQGLQMAL